MTEKTIHVSWLPDAVRSLRPSSADECTKRYFDMLSPFLDPIDGPHNPDTLMSDKRFDLQETPLITWRDGWLPLSCFFENVKPDAFSCQVAIPCQFWFVVPPQWRNRVQLYRVRSERRFNAKNLPKKVFFFGCFSPSFSFPDELESDIQRVCAELGGPLKTQGIEFYALFTSPIDHTWSQPDRQAPLIGAMSLVRNFGTKISLPSIESVFSQSSYQDCMYCEFNRGRLIGDTITKHYLLSRGAGLWEDQTEIFDIQKTIPLSNQHQIELADWGAFPQMRSVIENVEDYSTFRAYLNLLLAHHPLPASWIRHISNHILGRLSRHL